MPPRSVCLNVFTTSLGNDIGLGKEREVGVEVKEMEDRMEGVETVAERGRHDSVQGSPNDTIAATHSYAVSITNPAPVSPPLTFETTTSKVPRNLPVSRDPDQDQALQLPGVGPTICFTCSRAPVSGFSLQRCSRCKSAFYCSKTCQRAAWRSHKYECEPIGSSRGFSPSSTMNTPDISTPASPVANDAAYEPSVMLNAAAENEMGPPLDLHCIRVPQSVEDWKKDHKVYTPSFPRSDFLHLGFYIEDAYRLWVEEHGGMSPNMDVTLAEYGAFIAAVSERVKFPVELDLAKKAHLLEKLRYREMGLYNTAENPDPRALRTEPSSAVIPELRRIIESVYGKNQPGRPVQR